MVVVGGGGGYKVRKVCIKCIVADMKGGRKHVFVGGSTPSCASTINNTPKDRTEHIC